MRFRIPVLCLVACNNPLSNDIFYADDAFLDALPDTDRIGFSQPLTRYPRQGTDPVLRAMATEAEHLDPSITLLIGVTNILVNSRPSDRGDNYRHWDARAVSTPAGSTRELWFLRADIARSSAESDFTWQIEGAPEEGGPWQVVGSGRHDPDGAGSFSWDLAGTAALVGSPVIGTLDAVYTGTHADRETEFDIQASALSTRSYAFVGANVFAWVGEVQLPEQRVEGAGMVFAQPDGSGRGQLTVYLDGAEQVQEGCWGINGETRYAAGSLTEAVGQPSNCTVDDVF